MTHFDDSQNSDKAGTRLARETRDLRRKRKLDSAARAGRSSAPGIAPAPSVSLKLGISAGADTDSVSEIGSGRDQTPVNDNRNEVAILRRDGDDPAVAIGLALHHVRLGRDVPFAIVNTLFRHAEAGDGAAKAMVDMLRRRAEQRQHARWRRYVGKGLRAPLLPGPHGQTARMDSRSGCVSGSGGDSAKAARLALVNDRLGLCDGDHTNPHSDEAGR